MPHHSANSSTGDSCFISTDRRLLDLDAIFAFLVSCYWSPGIARSRIERAIEHSLCFGVYDKSIARTEKARSPQYDALPSQVGFARVVTDYSSFAYLCDVFVLESHRGRGLSKRLMQEVMVYPSLQGLRRFSLMTRDAHGLYEQFGFTPMSDPTKYMEVLDRESYKRDVQQSAG